MARSGKGFELCGSGRARWRVERVQVVAEEAHLAQAQEARNRPAETRRREEAHLAGDEVLERGVIRLRGALVAGQRDEDRQRRPAKEERKKLPPPCELVQVRVHGHSLAGARPAEQEQCARSLKQLAGVLAIPRARLTVRGETYSTRLDA